MKLTLLILTLALGSISAGEKRFTVGVATNAAIHSENDWVGNLIAKRETNWVDSYFQTELGTVSSNTYIVGTFHGKTTTNLIDSVAITNLTRRYNIKQVRDYNGPFQTPVIFATNLVYTNLIYLR